MKENKNIDRLFQEKFKDFEAHPSDRVWNTIAAAQKQKEDRKVIPFWWKLSGIAASLAILLTVGGIILTSNKSSTNEVEVVDIQDPTRQDNNIPLNSPRDKATQVTSNNNGSSITTNDDRVSDNVKVNTFQIASTLKNDSSLTNKGSNDGPLNRATSGSGSEANSAFASTDTKAIANNASQNQLAVRDGRTLPFKGSEKEDPLEKGKNTTIENTQTAITETTDKALTKDLTAEAQKIENLKLEEAIAQENQDANTTKWNVGAIAAPVYYGDFGGSGLDKQFADNDKSGGVNLSYGVQVSYTVTPRLKVRTGISNLDLSYNTNEISFTTSGQGRSLQSVNYAEDVSTLIITDGSSNQASDGFGPQRVGVTAKGSLEQRLSYLEIPMEAVYTISDKRLGLSVIGGVSTLLLNDNQVVLASDELTTNLGSATNVNDISFSTNIGLGLDYKMTDKLQLNLEPSFKYQINGFNQDAVNFRPYYLGVYTGVSYKF